jgi:hypothetical protein
MPSLVTWVLKIRESFQAVLSDKNGQKDAALLPLKTEEGPTNQEMWDTLEAGKDKEMDSPLILHTRTQILLTPCC